MYSSRYSSIQEMEWSGEVGFQNEIFGISSWHLRLVLVFKYKTVFYIFSTDHFIFSQHLMLFLLGSLVEYRAFGKVVLKIAVFNAQFSRTL